MAVAQRILMIGVTCGLLVSTAWSQEEPVNLQVGDDAPHFAGTTDSGETWDSKEHAGKKAFVVYFYPADMTGGCTMQACSYRDAMEKYADVDVEVIGVSGDSAENHKHFKEMHELNFTLLADPDGKIAKAFGVKTGPGGSIQKVVDGVELTLERGVTANRWTFVIDGDWKIAHKNTQVNAGQDSAQVLKVVRKLQRDRAAVPN